ncbi:MAG TPA: DNA polymerase [Candidatus Paceibacterota bacterium]
MAKKDVKLKRLVLLDVHAILHRAYHALPDFASSKGEPTGALYGLCTMLIKIIQELKPNYIAACFDLPGKTYRHEVYDAYKAGRAKTDDALVAQIIRSRDVFKAFNIPGYEKEGFEADDMLGTIVEQVKRKNEKVKDGEGELQIVIASGDMDTLQLVDGKKVMVYTLKKGINDTILYDEEGVMARFGFVPKLLPDYKGLRGDPSDNIIGIKGIGDKTASLLIQNFGSIEDIYKKLKKDEESFEKAGVKERIVGLLKDNEEEARFSKMLAEIRRDAPIEFSLPDKEWRDGLEIDPIMNLFSELDFRTLGARVRDAFHFQPSLLAGTEASTEQGDNMADQTIDPKELKETSLALWVLNSNIAHPGIDEILQFAQTKDFKKARETILSEVEKQGLKKVLVDIELPLIPVVERMQEVGVKIDKDYLKKLSLDYHKELSKFEAEIWKMAGEEFNINSPKQLGTILFDKMGLTAKNLKKTEGGARSTRESELLKMTDSHPIIKKILEHRELQKLLSTYIDTIPELLDKNNRLHTTLLQAGSTTGRMSSNNPNLQNIPIKTELGRNIRKAFIAEEGWTLLALDYSQIELRIAAFLSEDKRMIEIFRKGEDIHTSVAAYVFKVPSEKVDREMRRKAKVINFGIIYGMGINSLRANLGTTRAEAQHFYDEYFSNFKTLAEYLEKVRSTTAKTGYTETFFGRRRFFEGINSRIPYIRAAAERMAINAPIQGTGADIIKLAMVSVFRYLEEKKLDKKVRPLLQVHDELLYEVKKDAVKDIAQEIKKNMEEVIDSKKTYGVVCIAEAKAGPNWDEMEKLA